MYTREELDFLEAAREFARGAIRPNVTEWDADAAWPVSLTEELGALGFWALRIPEAFGGVGLDLPTYLAALEGLAWGDASVSMVVAIHNGLGAEAIARFAAPEVQETWLPRAATGEVQLAYAVAEAESGAELSSLSTVARRKDDGWVLQGEKSWVTNGSRAGAFVVAAVVEGHGPTLFLVPADADGIEIGDPEPTLGFAAAQVCSVEFRDVVLPGASVLGEIGHGARDVADLAPVARIGVAAQAVGIAQAALEHALDYARERSQFGRTLSEFGAIRQKLGEMSARISAARALVVSAARSEGPDGRKDGGLSFATSAAEAKMVASETATWVADEAVQIFGGYGYMRHYPVEKLLRDAQGTGIYEGTTEALREVTAAALLEEV